VYLHLGLDVCTWCQLLVPCYMLVFMMSQIGCYLTCTCIDFVSMLSSSIKIKESMSHANICISSLPKGCLVIWKLISSYTNQHWVRLRFIVCCRRIKYAFSLTCDGHFLANLCYQKPFTYILLVLFCSSMPIFSIIGKGFHFTSVKRYVLAYFI
jgi:hypothetical protein